MSNFDFKSLLYFTRKERHGIILLIMVFLAFKFSPSVLRKIYPAPELSLLDLEYMYPGLTANIDSLENRITIKLAENPPQKYSSSNNYKEPEKFEFDPNRITFDSLILLGFPSWLADRLIAFRSSGAVFYSSEDLLNVYGMDTQRFEELLPYIEIPDRNFAVEDNYAGYQKQVVKPKIIIDINTADSMEFTQLYGIGPVLSSRIVKFREALGGFVSVDQLEYIYGLDSNTIQELAGQLKCSALDPRKILLNEFDISDLAAHPFISWSLAKSIVSYREMHGLIRDSSELFKLHLVNDEIYRKIVPYISYDTHDPGTDELRNPDDP